MTYADECLERASKATKGPWNQVGSSVHGNKDATITCYGLALNQQLTKNAEFIAHARTDVEELAKRLKKACEAIRDICRCTLFPCNGHCLPCRLADELEAPHRY